jgi:hypothetical protein
VTKFRKAVFQQQEKKKMKNLRVVVVCFLFATLSFLPAACKDACDDLHDICKDCNADAKDSCKSSFESCDNIKGPAGRDCCESIVDEWEELCE